MRLVVALGGNALLPKGASGTAQSQRQAAREALRKLAKLMDDNQVALTHGNGPQVGSLLLQQHRPPRSPEMPLDVLDAMTQGEIGYFIESAAETVRRAAHPRGGGREGPGIQASIEARRPLLRENDQPERTWSWMRAGDTASSCRRPFR